MKTKTKQDNTSPTKKKDVVTDLEVDNLRTIIIALNQKVKAKEDIEQEYELTKAALDSAQQTNSELHAQIQVAADEVADFQAKNEKF